MSFRETKIAHACTAVRLLIIVKGADKGQPEFRDLKEVGAELTLENRLLKKSVILDGGDDE